MLLQHPEYVCFLLIYLLNNNHRNCIAQKIQQLVICCVIVFVGDWSWFCMRACPWWQTDAEMLLRCWPAHKCLCICEVQRPCVFQVIDWTNLDWNKHIIALHNEHPFIMWANQLMVNTVLPIKMGWNIFSPPLMKWLWQCNLFLVDKVYNLKNYLKCKIIIY